MRCSFTLQHYREILEIAKSNGYTFLGFHESSPSPRRKVIYLRHDLDVCIEESLDMAALEAELGVRATYFILLDSPLYNPLSVDSIELITQIQEKGHWIGLHLDSVFLTSGDKGRLEEEVQCFLEFFGNKLNLVPVISFHRPVPEVLGKDFRTFVSVYSQRFFVDIKYISDSRGVWREGCPCQLLERGIYTALQILVHPIWWKRMESESIYEKLQSLLGARLEEFKAYLRANIEPFADLLHGR